MGAWNICDGYHHGPKVLPEHIKEAAQVSIAQYCWYIAIRAFASLTDKEQTRLRLVLNGFKKYAGYSVGGIWKSSVGHPLQLWQMPLRLAENKHQERPKWSCPGHQSQGNCACKWPISFVEMMHCRSRFVITHPKGYDYKIGGNHTGAKIETIQTGLEEAILYYVKKTGAASYRIYA